MTQKKIGKNHYSFRESYYKIPIGKKKEVQDELCRLFNTSYIQNVYPKIRSGFIDPRISIIEGVTNIFEKIGITDVWKITPLK